MLRAMRSWSSPRAGGRFPSNRSPRSSSRPGYFFSSAGRGATEPSRLIVLVYAGAVSLALGVVALGIGLLS